MSSPAGRTAGAALAPPQPGRVLEIVLEPRSCWAFNLRWELGETVWSALEESFHCDTWRRCEICGAMPASLQPRWRYVDSKATRVLDSFRMWCRLCALTSFLAGPASWNLMADEYEVLIAHIQRLNGYSDIELLSALDAAFAEFHRRSLLTFKSDLGLFTAFMERTSWT